MIERLSIEDEQPIRIPFEYRGLKSIYHEIAENLYKYKERKIRSIEFIVEGSLKQQLICIKYPGKKVEYNPKGRIYTWCNLYDFKVVPYIEGKAVPEMFTFKNMLDDFDSFKKNNEDYWVLINEIYEENILKFDPPKLQGIDSKIYLLTLKWLWILEDLNYNKKIRDCLNKDASKAKFKTKHTGVGRAKFFAALILLKENYFSKEEVGKIIPLFG